MPLIFQDLASLELLLAHRLGQWQRLLLVVFHHLVQEAFLLLIQVEHQLVGCNIHQWAVHQLSEDKILRLVIQGLDSHKLYKVRDTLALEVILSLNRNKLAFHRLALVCHKILATIKRKAQLDIQISDSKLLNKILDTQQLDIILDILHLDRATAIRQLTQIHHIISKNYLHLQTQVALPYLASGQLLCR